jgi:hypothetical protein
MTAVCQDSRLLGRLAFQRVLALISPEDRDHKKPEPGQGQAAWLEISETTGPPPDVAYGILPNRTRVPAGRESVSQ